MLILIVISLIPLAFKTEYITLTVVDKACAAVFVVDYLLRLITADYKLNDHSARAFIKYPFTLMAIIDLLSILPSFTPVNSSLKVLRLFRVFTGVFVRLVNYFWSFLSYMLRYVTMRIRVKMP